MLKCKVCGTANSSDSSICAKCGAALSDSRRNRSTENDKEIFSNTDAEEMIKSGDQKIDLFSSGEKYDKVRKGAVLKKIYKQEQAMGEISTPEIESEPEEIKPIVINRQSSSDIVGSKKYTGDRKRYEASKNRKIPTRIIEPVDSQLLGHKIKPNVDINKQPDDDEKVELKPSEPVVGIKKKNKTSSKPKAANTQKNNGENVKAVSDNRQNSERKKKSTQPPSNKTKGEAAAPKQNADPKKNANRNPKKEITEPRAGKMQVSENAAAVKKSSNNVSKKERSVQKGSAENYHEKKIKDAADTAKMSEPSKPAADSLNRRESAERIKAEKPKSAQQKPAKSDSAKDLRNDLPKSRKIEQPPKKPVAKVGENKKANAEKNENTARRAQQPSRQQTVALNKDKPYVQKSKKRSLADFTESDIDSHKNIAALSYIGILFLIPFAFRKSSDFCKAHAKQGIAVFIYSLIVSLVTLTAVVGLKVLLVWQLHLSFNIYNIAAAAVCIFMLIMLLVPVFSGAVSAFSGEYRSVPIVGKYVNKK